MVPGGIADSCMAKDIRPALRLVSDALTPTQRWAALRTSKEDWPQFLDLCAVLKQTYFSNGSGAHNYDAIARSMYALVYKHAGEYIADSDFLARESGTLSAAQMAMMQRQYTWAHVARYFGASNPLAMFEGLGGCSTVCVRTSEGWRMMRSLDWANAIEVAPAVRRIDYETSPGTSIHTVGILGMIGILTFCTRGICGAINFAPSRSVLAADMDADPLFLVRRLVLDQVWSDLDQCVERVRAWKVSSPVFLTLCANDKAVAIEITRTNRDHVRESQNGVLVQTNHFDQEGPFAFHNPLEFYEKEPPEGWWEADLMKTSIYRRRRLEEDLRRVVDQTSQIVELECLTSFSKASVLNNETVHWAWCDPQKQSIALYVRTRKNG